MEGFVVLGSTETAGAVESVVRAMPMLLELGRTLLKHLPATVWTENVISVAEILV